MQPPDHPLSVNLVSWDNGGGLSTDIEILTKTLTEAGCEVRFSGRRIRKPRNRVERLFQRIVGRLRHTCVAVGAGPFYDVNLFLESIAPRFLPYARLNYFIPNPEWFREENMPYLSEMDLVLCKTRDAVAAFKPLTSKTQCLGFTSADKSDGQVPRNNELEFLHAAGASLWKGTAAVVEAWSRHPEWPKLIVIRNPVNYAGEPLAKYRAASNIDYITERLDDRTLKEYQNACAIHVYPSEAEGFGHLIVEAMSCGAVVITTDGAPMNEIVTKQRGLLARAARTEPMRLGTSYFVDVDDLEQQVDRVLKMEKNERDALGRNAREWYESQHKAFKSAIRSLVNEALAGRRSNRSREATRSK